MRLPHKMLIVVTCYFLNKLVMLCLFYFDLINSLFWYKIKIITKSYIHKYLFKFKKKTAQAFVNIQSHDRHVRKSRSPSNLGVNIHNFFRISHISFILQHQQPLFFGRLIFPEENKMCISLKA